MKYEWIWFYLSKCAKCNLNMRNKKGESHRERSVRGFLSLLLPEIFTMKAKQFFFAAAAASMIFAGCSSTSTTPSEEVKSTTSEVEEDVSKAASDVASDVTDDLDKAGGTVSSLDADTKAKLDDFRDKAETIYNNGRDMVETTLDDPAFEETKDQIKSDIETVYADGKSVFNEAYEKLSSDPEMQQSMSTLKDETMKLYDLIKGDFDRSISDNQTKLKENMDNITTAMQSFDQNYHRVNNER